MLPFEHIFYFLGVGGVIALLRHLKRLFVIFKKQFVKLFPSPFFVWKKKCFTW